MNTRGRGWVVLALTGGIVASANALEVTVLIENVSPNEGAYLTPVWVGFHNGRFDLFEPDEPASPALERLAEDGNTGPLSALFNGGEDGYVDATIVADTGIPPLAPGETATMTFELKGDFRFYRFFSYSAMVIPSNDAFIANEDYRAIRLFNRGGEFVGASFTVYGWEVHDAGTELNDELPENTAFFGQMEPDTGQDEDVSVHDHVGLKRPGSGGVVDDPDFANANVIRTGAPVARIKITSEPILEDMGDALRTPEESDTSDEDTPLIERTDDENVITPLIRRAAPTRQ